MMLQKTGHDLGHDDACQIYAGRVNKQWVKFLNLPDTECIPCLDLQRLEEQLRSRRYAAFIVEGLQVAKQAFGT